MSINLLKKLVSSVVQPDAIRPAQRKPPQRVLTVDARAAQAAEFSSPKSGAEKMPIPTTWNEVIGTPRIWAEIRPLIVDED